MKMFPEKIDKPRVALVEGQDEVNLLKKLFLHLNLDGIQVIECGGCIQMMKNLPKFTKITGFEEVTRLAVFRDADRDFQSTFQSVCTALQRAGLVCPQRSGCFRNGEPDVGVFLLPNNSDPGALEDLFLSSVPDNAALNCVESFWTCVETLSEPPGSECKSRARAYLATRQKDCPSVGIAAQKGYWDFDSRHLDPLKAFLSDLAES